MRSNGCSDEGFACFGAEATRTYRAVLAEVVGSRS